MIDLHVHSNCSDGSSSVIEILEEANRKGVSLLSITDHDVIDAYENLKQINIRKNFDGKIITGIEITTTIDGELVEILGYGYNLEMFKSLINGKFLTFKEYKIQEFQLAVDTFKRNGIRVNENNIKFSPEIESCREQLMKECLTYPENVELLLYENSKDNVTNFSRNEFYNPNSRFYVNQSSLYISFQDAIDIIHKAGGFAFLAHPFVYSKNIVENLDEIVARFNLDGIECYYYSFTYEQTQYLLDFCEKNMLYVSGGSDYHGTVRPGVEIGIGKGNLLVDETKCYEWINMVNIFI